MSAIQPKSIAGSILRRIDSARYMENIPPMYLNGLNRDIDKLENVDLATAYGLRGSVYALLNEPQAIDFWGKAVDLNPNALNYHNLGFTKELLNQPEEALKSYRESLAVMDKPDVMVLELLAGRFINFFSYDDVMNVKNILEKLNREREDIPIFLKNIYQDVFNENKDVIAEFGLALNKLISSYIQPKLIQDVVYNFIDSNLYKHFYIKCLNETVLNAIVECNSAINDLIVEFESKYELDFNHFYVYCEAVE